MTPRKPAPASPDLAALPALPRDEGGPLFREPWEARAFALAIGLHERGAFSWPEWVAVLSDEIAGGRDRAAEDPADAYYRQWLSALERILREKGVVREGAVGEGAERIVEAALSKADHHHHHGHDPGHDDGHGHGRGHDRRH